MAQSKKNILLAITGMSPQVITETLYAIQRDKLPWPHEIHVVTTKKGKVQAELGLRGKRDVKENSILEKFCIDYKCTLPEIIIDVVPDAEGHEVDDAKTEKDQEALADFIMRKVAILCEDKNNQVHASLAGGRKTMTFYLGYAMTLFAKQDDRLSHVLISPDNYEGLSDFYYPTPKSLGEVVIRGKSNNELLDSSESKVTVVLVEIPFIRQRKFLEKSSINKFFKSNSDEGITYRQLIELQNFNKDEFYIQFDLPELKIKVTRSTGDSEDIVIDFSNNTIELAYYAMIARCSVKHIDIVRTPIEFDEPFNYAELFLEEMDRMLGRTPIYREDNINYARKDSQQMKDYKERVGVRLEKDYVRILNSKTVSAFERNGLTGQFLDDRRTKLKKIMACKLPADIVDIIVPSFSSQNKKGIKVYKVNVNHNLE